MNDNPLTRIAPAILLLACLLSPPPSSSSTAAEPTFTKPGCSYQCGNVSVPFPFGIDNSSCSLNTNFLLTCNRSANPPQLLFDNNKTVVDLSLAEATFTIITQNECIPIYPLGGISSPIILTQGQGPFSYSLSNRFVTVGCDMSATLIDVAGLARSACVSLCQYAMDDTCGGVGCCQSSIPSNIFNFSVNVNRTFASLEDYPCGFSFLMEQTSFSNLNITSLKKQLYLNMGGMVYESPVAVAWVVDENRTCADANVTCGANTKCTNSSTSGFIRGYRCSCNDGYYGNPYLPEGCLDVDECSDPQKHPCMGSCTNTMGNYTCSCPAGMKGDGKVSCKGFRILTLVAGISMSFGLMLLLVVLYLIYKYIKKRKLINLKKQYFEKNGGLLLEQQISLNRGKLERSKIFDAEELKKATDNYNENRILGKGGQGTVYKGMLSDGSIVAIKKSGKMEDGQTGEFINEVVILTEINHKNIVKILGCCLETEVPLLVYEFISNGTLWSHIHDPNKEEFPPLIWADRFRIAREVAGALAYMHSATSMPIYHRDIKSSNILLDEKLRARVSDFGISRSLPSEKTHLTTLVQGTFGYLDPEYFHTHQFTDKSDVYSYGVVLAELLAGRKPIPDIVVEGEMGLAARFMSAADEDNLFELLDPQIVKEAERQALIAVANLARRCLGLIGKNRPTMTEVALELENLKRPADKHHPIPENNYYGWDRLMGASGQWDDVTNSIRGEIPGGVNGQESELALLTGNISKKYKNAAF